MTTATLPTTDPRRPAELLWSAQRPDAYADGVAAGSAALAAARILRPRLNWVMVALATLNTVGTVAAGVALSLLAPTLLGFGLVGLCCVGTVIGWQLVD